MSDGCGELKSLCVSQDLLLQLFPRSLNPFIRNFRDHIFIRYFETANLSPFANYICLVARINSFKF